MDLKAIIGVFFYYLIMASIYYFGVSHLGGSAIVGGTAPNTNFTDYTANTTTTTGISGFFSSLGNSLSNIGATIGFMFFGIGLPTDTPSWAAWIISGLLTLITIISAVILINAFWDGGGGG
jgi:hypothetical protein